jgi:hypothetical protein
MKYRKLRIAWSVAWGVLCLLLIALCVRSYWWCDSILLGPRYVTSLGSMSGKLYYYDCGLGQHPFASPDWPWIICQSEPGGCAFFDSGRSLFVPHWVPILMVAAVAAGSLVPWSNRFSVRTLLIAMTLVAVGLGWAVYWLRN